MACVHGKDNESSLGLGRFIELGHNQAETKTALGIPIAALNGAVLTRILVHLAFALGVGIGGFSAA